jgi:hypothetical protein
VKEIERLIQKLEIDKEIIADQEGDTHEEARQLRRPYFRTTRRPCSRMSALYMSIWLASLDQLEERFLRTPASGSLCANFIKRRHSAD